nr:N-acetylmuramoyl-L-alanine amidase [uncultured Anaerocolumna sp.]
MKTVLANKANYGGSRKTSSIKFIVIHYTGNDGDSDSANANYFANNVVKSSAHYFVDDDSITQSVPDDYTAWHCGTNKTYYHPTCRNANSIGIEMCDTVKDGTYNLSNKTRKNVIELVQILMKKYRIPIENVIRHYDVTHKICPAYFVNDSNAWIAFKNEISGKVVESKPSKSDIPYMVKVTADVLNIREDAGTGYKVTGQIKDNGVYTIVEEKDGWGKLKSGVGWVSLKYCEKLK